MTEPDRCAPFTPKTIILVVCDAEPQDAIDHVRAGLALSDAKFFAGAAMLEGMPEVALTPDEQGAMLEPFIHQVITKLKE